MILEMEEEMTTSGELSVREQKNWLIVRSTVLRSAAEICHYSRGVVKPVTIKARVSPDFLKATWYSLASIFNWCLKKTPKQPWGQA